MIVDERSAAFFALGAAQATGAPVAVLCTSGTAAANLHPAVCEADHSAAPLIVADGRPPAGAAGHRCGPDDRPDQALRVLGALVLRSRDPRRRRRRAAPFPLDRLPGGRRRPRGTTPRARPPEPALAGAARPGPGQGRGDRRRARAGGPGRAPADRRHPDRPRAVGFPPRGGRQAHRRSALRSHRRRPPARPRPSRAARRARPNRRLPDPRRAHLPDQMRAPRPLPRRHHLRPAAARRTVREPGSSPTSCCGSARCRPASRCGAGSPRPAPTRSRSTPLAAGTSRPGGRRRCCGRTRPTSRRAGRRGSARSADPPAPGSRPRPPRGGRSRLSSTRLETPTEPGLHAALGDAHATATSSTPPRACRSATRRPSSARSTPTPCFLCNRGANGLDGLISSGIGAADATGRPTTIVTGDLGLLHDLGGLAALREVATPVRIVVIDNDGGGIFHFLPRRRALDREEFEALLGTPRASAYPARRASSSFPTAGSTRSRNCRRRSPPAPA